MDKEHELKQKLPPVTVALTELSQSSLTTILEGFMVRSLHSPAGAPGETSKLTVAIGPEPVSMYPSTGLIRTRAQPENSTAMQFIEVLREVVWHFIIEFK